MQEFVPVELEVSYSTPEKWTYKLIIINKIKFQLNAFNYIQEILFPYFFNTIIKKKYKQKSTERTIIIALKIKVGAKQRNKLF